MGYYDEWGNWIDSTGADTMDMAGTSIDSGTLGDPAFGSNGGGGISMPDYGPVSGLIPNITQTGAMGGAVMAGAGMMARGISSMAVAAIVKLSQRLGGASGSVVGYGRKVWASLSGWAAKNPGVSLMSTLVSLGLTVEEAAHFIAWGATSKRKRRTRGISGRDIKTVRRTMRKFKSLQHAFSTACSPFRAHRRHK